jgi:hypothetical protein
VETPGREIMVQPECGPPPTRRINHEVPQRRSVVSWIIDIIHERCSRNSIRRHDRDYDVLLRGQVSALCGCTRHTGPLPRTYYHATRTSKPGSESRGATTARSSQLSHGPRMLKFRILKDIWPDRNMDSATSRASDHYNDKPIV